MNINNLLEFGKVAGAYIWDNRETIGNVGYKIATHAPSVLGGLAGVVGSIVTLKTLYSFNSFSVDLFSGKSGNRVDAFSKTINKTIDAFNPSKIQSLTESISDRMMYTVIAGAVAQVSSVLLQLSFSYIYNVAIKNLNKPKLASEVKYVHWKDWLQENSGDLLQRVFTQILPVAFLGSVVTYLNIPGSLRDKMKMSVASAGFIALSMGVHMCYNIYKECQIQDKAPRKAIFAEELQENIRNIKEATKNIRKNGGFFQNVVLYGPGGTGKSLVASEEIAKYAEMNYVKMSGGDLAQYIKTHTHVSELNDLFMKINARNVPTVLFVDEAESLCQTRDRLVDKQEYMQLLNAFLNATGTESNKIMLVMATNRPQDLDTAVLSRMDHQLFLGPPAQEERKKILDMYIEQLFTKEQIQEFFPESLVLKMSERTEGLTGRALFKMVNALFGNMNVQSDKKLTPAIIEKTLVQFITQERRLNKMLGRTMPVYVTSPDGSMLTKMAKRWFPKKKTMPPATVLQRSS